MKNGILLVRFTFEEGKDEVLHGEIYHFDNKPLIVKEWVPEIDFSKEELYSVLIWVKLPGLEFKYWSAKSLSKIDSLIGKPLMVDKNTEQKIGLSFAKSLIEVQIERALSEVIQFKNEKGKILEQQVNYDWKPNLCDVCHKYGHTASECRKNKAKKPNGIGTDV